MGSAALITFWNLRPTADALYDSALGQARATEDGCAREGSTSEQIQCFERVIDWWRSSGHGETGHDPSTEIARILESELRVDAGRIEAMSSLARLIYGSEMNDVTQGRKKDFSDEALRVFSERENGRRDLDFWMASLEIPPRILAQTRFASIGMRSRAGAELTRRLREARRQAALPANRQRHDARAIESQLQSYEAALRSFSPAMLSPTN